MRTAEHRMLAIAAHSSMYFTLDKGSVDVIIIVIIMHEIPSFFLSIHFNITLPCTLICSKCLLPSLLPTKILYACLVTH
jgi:hypothetical protein